MIEVTRSTTLPADTLWPVLSDVRRWADWLPTVDAVRALEPDRPEEVGASYVVDQPGLPRATWTITDWRPGAGFTWESAATGVHSTGRHELAPTDGRDDHRAGHRVERAAGRLLRLLLGRKTRSYVTREAEALEATATARTA